jgi:phage portal protein BeeE
VNLLSYLREGTRDTNPLAFQEWVNYFTYNGLNYPLRQTLTGDSEPISGNFSGLVEGAYKSNGIVFACMVARMMVFSEARFQYQRMEKGRPGELFDGPGLRMLDRPWANGTTGDLLTRMISDADLAGNAFIVRRGSSLRRLRPDWVTLVLGSNESDDVVAGDIDAEVLGLIYRPGGPGSGRDPVALPRNEFAHFAPLPDPGAFYRGMSWLTPVIKEIMADGAATTHKLKFFENGATPNMIVKLDSTITKDAYEAWVDMFENKFSGSSNAYRTLYLGGGADVTVVGKDFQQLDFKVTQGAGETRIAAAARVPPVLLGISEGLSGSSLNQGNFQAARRSFADGTMRPLWRNVAGSLETITRTAHNSRLWFDDRDVAFLREDEKDAAEIQQVQAAAMKGLIDAGFEPASVVAATTSGDIAKLKHTGLYSAQLQPAGTTTTPASLPANEGGTDGND